MGHTFFEGTMLRIADALESISQVLSEINTELSNTNNYLNEIDKTIHSKCSYRSGESIY